jgi:two-component system, OmpR family, sensor histidine kinase ChvG
MPRAYIWHLNGIVTPLLDRPAREPDLNTPPPEGQVGGARLAFRLRLFLRQTGRLLSLRLGSSLVRRIVLLNMFGLVALLVGFLWLNQTRPGVVDARVQSLQVQGAIISAAIAGTAVVDGGSIIIDPERLLDLQTGESTLDEGLGLEFSLNPERVAPILRRLVTPANLRARIYDRDGTLLLDTRSFYARGDIQRLDLPPAGETTLFERSWSSWKRRFGRTGLGIPEDNPAGRLQQEVQRAFQGISSPVVRVNASGDTIVSYGFPIQRLRVIRGVLQLSTEDGDIDEVIADERLSILMVFAGVFAIMALLSLLLANTIAKPMERLAVGAERVRRSIKSRQQIPDFSNRSDEIGHLSAALRDMTNALYSRIAAIESFAADVAHELKNPLTSLRSAVETLPMVKSDDARTRLLNVIQHDVRRLDRLISDISDASRLDAELAKSDAEPVDLAALLDAVVSLSNDMRKPDQARVVLKVEAPARSLPTGKAAAGGDNGYRVIGHDSRLGQVFTNLLDNARSFAPPGTDITVSMRRDGGRIVAKVEDQGPGIPDHALERIFERFYTDRPIEQGFGQNSGLGLSISRQIIEAHRGTITASNRLGRDGVTVGGACFTVTLPVADTR